MLFYAFIIIALQCTSCFGCTLRILYNFSSRTNEVVPIRCYYFQSVSQIAICLLQLNGIASLMKCSEDAPDKAHRWPVAPGGFYDNRDLVLRGNTYEGSVNQRIDPDDGAFTATPRAILVRAIESCVNHRGPHDYFCDSDLLATFAHCPYANFKDFMDCLCCLNVGQEDFEGLQTHIDLTDLGNKAYSPSSRYQWTCPNTMCNENGFLVKPRAKREYEANLELLLYGEKQRGIDGAEPTRTFTLNSNQMNLPSRTWSPPSIDPTQGYFYTYNTTFEEETGTPSGNGESSPTPIEDVEKDEAIEDFEPEGRREEQGGGGDGEEDAAFRFAPCWKAVIFWSLAWVAYSAM